MFRRTLSVLAPAALSLVALLLATDSAAAQYRRGRVENSGYSPYSAATTVLMGGILGLGMGDQISEPSTPPP